MDGGGGTVHLWTGTTFDSECFETKQKSKRRGQSKIHTYTPNRTITMNGPRMIDNPQLSAEIVVGRNGVRSVYTLDNGN